MIRSAQVTADYDRGVTTPIAVVTGYRESAMRLEDITVCAVVYDNLDETQPGWVSRAERLFAEDGVLFV